MKRIVAIEPADSPWPPPGRMLLIALCAVVLCSCRGPDRPCYDGSALPEAMRSGLPQTAYTGVPVAEPAAESAMGLPDMSLPAPPGAPSGPWAPPGFRKPWPQDEYLRDGGDRGLPASVGGDWEVRGLELEDTVAHYDTLDGQTVVEPSNRVHIYSPRFGAVRQVVSLAADEQIGRAGGVHLATRLFGPKATQLVTSSKQNVQTDNQIGTKPLVIARSRQGDGVMSRAIGPRGFQDVFLSYENLSIIRQGVMEGTDMAWLARGVNAAVAWAHTQAVQVVLDHQAAMAEVSDQTSQSVYTVKEPPPAPKLRVVKVASTRFAEPGDEVAFTIRFDNVGNQTIGNVTIIDNLTTRLEYVADSAQCSLDAQFITQPNEGDSLVIRCEVTDPLPAGEGGVIRFRCKVR